MIVCKFSIYAHTLAKKVNLSVKDKISDLMGFTLVLSKENIVTGKTLDCNV
jgi:uncharacterized protein YfaS (alpha-2-macroglobulin family)